MVLALWGSRVLLARLHASVKEAAILQIHVGGVGFFAILVNMVWSICLLIQFGVLYAANSVKQIVMGNPKTDNRQ